MKYFTKITQDEYDERILWFLKNPLRFAVYYLCYTRARRTNSEIKTNNLKINECGNQFFCDVPFEAYDKVNISLVRR